MGAVGGGIEIVRAREEHLAGVMALAEYWQLDPGDSGKAGQTGFLVSDYTIDDYRERLTSAEHFWVAVKGTDVVGFLLAYSDARIGPEEWLNHRIKSTMGAFLVIKQVCVAQSVARAGVGSRLYHHVLEQWTQSPVIAAVVSEPYNEASVGFHRKLGFDELTRITPPDGRRRMVWVARKPREQLLQTQYTVAVDLYKHEDNTNWQKLNNFLYITAGLAAALGFTFGADKDSVSAGSARALGVAICFVGVVSALAFAQMLRFGRRYLSARKRSAIELEEVLAWHGGQRVVGRDAETAGNDWLRQSPTGLVMIVLPLLVGLAWLGVLVFVVVR
ncbi:GNAT family N-acetyltransferase [Streptomyces sp. NPDC048106]|uniref:GNAT family N-acetyltransferase n=1 Tax=Streptomyces sp. NPDC048106 TaxID=3155750 RepID=UPI003454E603